MWLRPPPVNQAPLATTANLSTVAIIVGIYRHKPSLSAPWWLLAAANTVSTIGGMLLGRAADHYPGVSLVPQLIMLLAGPLTAAAALVWLRTYSKNTARTVAIDSALVGVGALMAAWVLLLSPAVGAGRSFEDPRFASGVQLVVDAFVVAMVAHVAFTAARGNRAFVLIGSATILLLASDVVYAADATTGSGDGRYFMIAATLSYGCFGAAALNPGMAKIGAVESLAPDRPHPRFVVVALACVLASAIPATRPPFGVTDQVVRATILVTLIAGVLWRSERAVRTIAHKESDARHRATHDELTGLSNRAWLYASQRRHGVGAPARPTSLLFMDLDNFKLVNDSYGHRTGDELIVAAAERLEEVVGDSGNVHRHGGDEFVVTTHADRLATIRLAEQILAAFSKPFELSQVRVTLSTSIGISQSSPDGEPADLDDLIREADSAMYHAKSKGAGSYAIFDDQLRERAMQKLQVTSALRDALNNREFELHYQPIVDATTERTATYEALLRWRHKGMLRTPGYFIEVAESSDIIIEIGAWAINSACEQLARFWRETADRPAVSVNLSARQLRDESFVDVVVAALAQNQLPPSALWLELTETALIDDHDVALTILNRLSAMGVTICLDDFGIGYSALSNLNKYPIDIVKIDKSFIATLGSDSTQNAKDRVLVNSIEAMSNALGLVTVAEGVESTDQRQEVRNIGCRYAQGWLYGLPQPRFAPASTEPIDDLTH